MKGRAGRGRGGRGGAGWTYTRWVSRGAAAGRSRPARTGRGSSSCTCRSRGPWCCAHTRTAGCPRARSTGWRAGCTCTCGDTGTKTSASSASSASSRQAGREGAGAGPARGGDTGGPQSNSPRFSVRTRTPAPPHMEGVAWPTWVLSPWAPGLRAAGPLSFLIKVSRVSYTSAGVG